VSHSNAAVSGTESDSDSGLSPDHLASGSAPRPLTAIVEQRRAGEDSEDDEEEAGALRAADIPRAAGDSDIRAGYLWKKGERRKVCVLVCREYDAILHVGANLWRYSPFHTIPFILS
jgi:hypothetical protein